MEPEERNDEEIHVLRTVPALARIAGAAYWRSARWTARTSVRATGRVMRAAVSGQEPAELFRSTGTEIRDRTRRILGIPEEPEPMPEEPLSEDAKRTLREQGEALLRRSADVNLDEGSHPAYARILQDLAPDEARILRMLAKEGPQPSVDVRAGLFPLQATSELVAAGLNMIGPESGCRHLDDVPAYLNNLFRLGLVWFSREPLPDPARYQVLEAQPEVTEALERVRHTRTVRRTIHLTPFGADFCQLCLPLEGAGELELDDDESVERPEDPEEDGPPGEVPLDE